MLRALQRPSSQKCTEVKMSMTSPSEPCSKTPQTQPSSPLPRSLCDPYMSHGQTTYIQPNSLSIRTLYNPYPITCFGVLTLAHVTPYKEFRPWLLWPRDPVQAPRIQGLLQKPCERNSTLTDRSWYGITVLSVWMALRKLQQPKRRDEVDEAPKSGSYI